MLHMLILYTAFHHKQVILGTEVVSAQWNAN